MNKGIRDIVRGMRNREGMYVQPPDWNNIVSFLHGFSAGMRSSGQKSELGEFELWLEKKAGLKCASGWTWIVEHKFANGDSKNALPIFYLLWDEYLEDNPVGFQNSSEPDSGPKPEQD